MLSKAVAVSVAIVIITMWSVGLHYAGTGPYPQPDWNVMDWSYEGRADFGTTVIDKRASGDSTAYLISNVDTDSFGTTRIEVQVPGECWTGTQHRRGFKWAQQIDPMVPCRMFEVAKFAYERSASDG